MQQQKKRYAPSKQAADETLLEFKERVLRELEKRYAQQSEEIMFEEISYESGSREILFNHMNCLLTDAWRMHEKFTKANIKAESIQAQTMICEIVKLIDTCKNSVIPYVIENARYQIIKVKVDNLFDIAQRIP